MVDFPKNRVTATGPLGKMEVYFSDPLLIKSSKLRKAAFVKYHIVIFVCLVTKVSQIELVSE